MKTRTIIFTLFAVFLVLLVGCKKEGEEIEKIEVRQNVDDEYKQIKMVKGEKDIEQMEELLDDVKWESGIADMVRPPDYRLYVYHKDKKKVLYELWIAPKKDGLEITTKNQYGKMTIEDSNTLFKMMTGKNLSDGQK